MKSTLKKDTLSLFWDFTPTSTLLRSIAQKKKKKYSSLKHSNYVLSPPPTVTSLVSEPS